MGNSNKKRWKQEASMKAKAKNLTKFIKTKRNGQIMNMKTVKGRWQFKR